MAGVPDAVGSLIGSPLGKALGNTGVLKPNSTFGTLLGTVNDITNAPLNLGAGLIDDAYGVVTMAYDGLKSALAGQTALPSTPQRSAGSGLNVRIDGQPMPQGQGSMFDPAGLVRSGGEEHREHLKSLERVEYLGLDVVMDGEERSEVTVTGRMRGMDDEYRLNEGIMKTYTDRSQMRLIRAGSDSQIPIVSSASDATLALYAFGRGDHVEGAVHSFGIIPIPGAKQFGDFVLDKVGGSLKFVGDVGKGSLGALNSALIKMGIKRACFVAGTMIHTERGLVPIETIAAGDKVWSRSEWDEGESGYRKVVDAGCLGEKEIWEVHVGTPDGRTETFRATGNHPFWVDNDSEDDHWVAAEELQPGEALRLADGSGAHVVSVTKTDDVGPVYNFEVEGFHTYHIGELGVWVHNDDCIALTREKFLRLVSDPDKGGQITPGSIEELRTALAAQRSGLISGVSHRGERGIDLVSGEGLNLSIKALHPNRIDDLLTDRKIGGMIAGMIAGMQDENWRLLIDTQNVHGSVVSDFIGKVTQAGIPRTRIIIPNSDAYRPIIIDGEVF